MQLGSGDGPGGLRGWDLGGWGVVGQVPRARGEASGGGAAAFPPLEGSHIQKTRGPPGAGPAAGAWGGRRPGGAERRGEERREGSSALCRASTPLSRGGERRGEAPGLPPGERRGAGHGEAGRRPRGRGCRRGSAPLSDAAWRGREVLPVPCATRTQPLGGGGARAHPGAGGAQWGRAGLRPNGT